MFTGWDWKSLWPFANSTREHFLFGSADFNMTVHNKVLSDILDENNEMATSQAEEGPSEDALHGASNWKRCHAIFKHFRFIF